MSSLSRDLTPGNYEFHAPAIHKTLVTPIQGLGGPASFESVTSDIRDGAATAAISTPGEVAYTSGEALTFSFLNMKPLACS